MKIINWLKNHIVSTLIILLLISWTGIKLWSHVATKLFSHPKEVYVETMIIEPQMSMQTWQAVGIVKVARNIVLSSEVVGTVDNLAAFSGQTVKQGDVLLNISHAAVLAQFQKDIAILNQKKLYYQRQQHLLKTNAVSQEAFSESWSEFQQAQATVNADAALLDKYIIRAPFSGVIGIWQVDAGQLVRAGDPLITLTQVTPTYIDFTMPANALSSIKVQDNIQFKTTTYPDQNWIGKVVAIDPQLDNDTRSIRMRAQVDNLDGKLVSGLYGQVSVVRELPPQLFIPQQAVIYDPQGASVYVLQNNVVQRQPIILGARHEDDIAVKSGLKPGNEVVTAGIMKLFPGTLVTIAKRSVQKAYARQAS